MQIQKSEIQSAIATSVISIIILLVLLFFGMTAKKNDMDEGVMISFGNEMEGYGEQEPVATSSIPQPSSQPVTPTPVTDEDLMTQEDPSVVMERERRRKEEEQRIAEQRQREIEERRIAEEQRRKAEEEARLAAEREAKANAVKNLTGDAFSRTGGGEGETTGDAMRGNPVGKGSSGGNSWSLSGRNMVSQFFKPSYNSNEEGIIVISIRVDAQGNVTSAQISTGTTISDAALRNASLEAAKKNKFSVGNGVAMGTITYKFVLN